MSHATQAESDAASYKAERDHLVKLVSQKSEQYVAERKRVTTLEAALKEMLMGCADGRLEAQGEDGHALYKWAYEALNPTS